MRRAVSALVAAALVVLAFVLVRTEPSEELAFAPFDVRVQLGEQGTGRDIRAVVDDVALADVVEYRDWSGETSGVWLVVSARMGTLHDSSLPAARLTVGERYWVPSLRPPVGLLASTPLDPGLPRSGAIVFELPGDLPDEAGAASAVLELSTGTDTRLDSTVSVVLDLGELAHESTVTVEHVERTSW